MVTAPPQGPEWISILDLDFFGALNRDDVDFRFGKWEVVVKWEGGSSRFWVSLRFHFLF
jgi:hypothetical protein